jgi:hypothetical protein
MNPKLSWLTVMLGKGLTRPIKYDFYTLIKRPTPIVTPLALHVRTGPDSSYATWVLATHQKPHAEYLQSFMRAYQHEHGKMPDLDLMWEDNALEINWSLTKPMTAAPPPESKDVEWVIRGWSKDELHRFCAYNWLNVLVMDMENNNESPRITMIKVEPSTALVVTRLKQMMS